MQGVSNGSSALACKPNIFKHTSTATNSASNGNFKLQHHLQVTAKWLQKNVKFTSDTTAASMITSIKFSLTENKSAQPLHTPCCSKPVMYLQTDWTNLQMTTTASNQLNFVDKSKHLQMLQMLQISTRTAKPTSLYWCFLHNNGCTVPLSNVYKNICKKSSSCCKMHATPSTSTLQEVLLPPMMPSSCKPAYFCMESPSM